MHFCILCTHYTPCCYPSDILSCSACPYQLIILQQDNELHLNWIINHSLNTFVIFMLFLSVVLAFMYFIILLYLHWLYLHPFWNNKWSYYHKVDYSNLGSLLTANWNYTLFNPIYISSCKTKLLEINQYIWELNFSYTVFTN